MIPYFYTNLTIQLVCAFIFLLSSALVNKILDFLMVPAAGHTMRCLCLAFTHSALCVLAKQKIK